MSIIYNTLNRLELEDKALTDNLDKAGIPHPVRKSMSFSVKALAMLMMLIFAGTGVLIWQWGDQFTSYSGLTLANTSSKQGLAGESNHELSPLATGEQIQPDAQLTAQSGDTRIAKDQSAVFSTPAPPQAVPEIVDVPTKKFKVVLAAMGKQQQVSPVVSSDDGDQVRGREKPGPQPSTVTAEKQVPTEPVQVIQGRRTVVKVDQFAESHDSKTIEVVSDTGKRSVTEKESPHKKQPGETNVAAVNVVSGMIKSSAARYNISTAASRKHEMTEVDLPDNEIQPGRVDKVVEEARVALSKGSYQQALVALQVLSSAPEDRVDYWLIKGSTHMGLGQLDPAEKAFAAAQLLAPGNAQLAVQRAVLKQEKNDHAGALEILKDAVISHPDVPEVFLNQGYSQQALGSLAEARHSFRIFLRMTEGRSLYREQRRVVSEWLAQFSFVSS